MSDPALRILIVSHGLPPDSVGGVEQHVEGLARALCARGHQIEIYCRSTRTDVPQGTLVQQEGSPFKVTRVVYRHEGLDTLASLYRSPLLDASFRRFLAGRTFDVAHVHHLTGLSTGVLDVLREHAIPVVLTLHDYWLVCPRGQMWSRDGQRCEDVEPERCSECLRIPFGALLEPGHEAKTVAARHQVALQELRSADRLVVPSARVIPPFAKLGVPRAAFHVVANGVDVEALATLPAPGGARTLRVGYLGTLIPSKGLDVLVDAVQLLPPGSVSLDVHGNAVPYHGDEGYLTRVFARLVPGHHVTYHGPYRTNDLPRILTQLDVVAAPALWHEAFGLTVREALAAGRPVVVSRVGGLQDAIEHGVQGFVVEPGDAAALAQALLVLAEDRAQLRRMAEAARGAARSFAAMATELLQIYRSVVRLDPRPAKP